MARYIELDAAEAEIKRRINSLHPKEGQGMVVIKILKDHYKDFLSFLNALEVKEIGWEKERMEECPYRQVGCTMYEGKILECKGACSWVVDYPKLKKLKAQKRE